MAAEDSASVMQNYDEEEGGAGEGNVNIETQYPRSAEEREITHLLNLFELMNTEDSPSVFTVFSSLFTETSRVSGVSVVRGSLIHD